MHLVLSDVVDLDGTKSTESYMERHIADPDTFIFNFLH